MPFYSNLSPGLYRRLQYSDYVRFRNSRQYRQRSLSSSYNFSTNLISDGHIYHRLPDETYDNQINKEISFKNLYHYTKIKINNENRFCPICQSDIVINTEIIRELNCSHIYHIDCIDKWLLLKNECPLCKKII
jgi:ribosomal protein S27AE